MKIQQMESILFNGTVVVAFQAFKKAADLSVLQPTHQSSAVKSPATVESPDSYSVLASVERIGRAKSQFKI